MEGGPCRSRSGVSSLSVPLIDRSLCSLAGVGSMVGRWRRVFRVCALFAAPLLLFACQEHPTLLPVVPPGTLPLACEPIGALPFTGDFLSDGGGRLWLRQSPTVATLTLISSGEFSPSNPPELFRVRGFCGAWLLVADLDGNLSRLDLRAEGSVARFCLRSISNAADGELFEPPLDAEWLSGRLP